MLPVPAAALRRSRPGRSSLGRPWGLLRRRSPAESPHSPPAEPGPGPGAAGGPEPGLGGAAVDPEIGQIIGPQGEGPDGALVIGQIPLPLGSAVGGAELRVLGRQGPKAHRRIEMAEYGVHHPGGHVRLHHGEGHGQGPDLIAADLIVGSAAGNHVPEIAVRVIELLPEGRLGLVRPASVVPGGLFQQPGRVLENFQGVVPVGVELPGLPWRGVGRKPSIRTSIHVTCHCPSPAQSRPSSSTWMP